VEMVGNDLCGGGGKRCREKTSEVETGVGSVWWLWTVAVPMVVVETVVPVEADAVAVVEEVEQIVEVDAAATSAIRGTVLRCGCLYSSSSDVSRSFAYLR
jgi:hypothetical protein